MSDKAAPQVEGINFLKACRNADFPNNATLRRALREDMHAQPNAAELLTEEPRGLRSYPNIVLSEAGVEYVKAQAARFAPGRRAYRQGDIMAHYGNFADAVVQGTEVSFTQRCVKHALRLAVEDFIVSEWRRLPELIDTLNGYNSGTIVFKEKGMAELRKYLADNELLAPKEQMKHKSWQHHKGSRLAQGNLR